ncbi:MAG: LysM peptidoglycan-binding domain-containing protein [Firmicutes bacterium]|nr:LysM peptidoglycan-binding domain-containing protein [Bacillota bacterium]
MADEEKENEKVETAQVTPTPSCPGGFLYEIRSGDTFYALARRFGVSLEAILAANPGVDPRNLQVGQLVCIPGAVTPPTPPTFCPGGTPYVIRAGDTLYLLAQRFGTTVDALLRANPGIDPRNLQIGQVICIPVTVPGPPPCPGGILYVIAPGDTLFLLASRFGTTVQAILAANPGIDPNRLQVGQTICIPVSPVQPRACSFTLLPQLPGVAPNAGGAVWLRTDATGATQILVSATNLPSPTALGANWYTALFTWDTQRVYIPMQATPGTGVWAGGAVVTVPSTFFSSATVNVFPGPVLGGLVASCR